jgi:Flp pilus assembly protein TadG
MKHGKPNWRRLWAGDEGAQIAEFALVLPLLTVLAIGVFDFGSAFNTKQRIVHAAREAARVAANQSTSDLSSASTGTDGSVAVVRDVVASYLRGANLSDCGLQGAAPTAAANIRWVYTVNSGCAGNLTLTIERGVPVTVSQNGSSVKLIETHVRLDYPYNWTFNRVIQLIAPGASYPSSSILTSEAYFQNLT